VVDINSGSRRTSRAGFIRFSDDGSDCAFFLDTSTVDANGECPVVALGPGRDNVVVALSFIEFVEGALSGRLEY
jgi:hypothetical protein